MKTNIELTKYCENALKEGWYYGWGAHGQKATTGLVDSLVNQYPEMNTRWRTYMMKAVTNNNKLCDCYGLVKGLLFTNSNGVMIYNASLDVNTTSAYNRAKEKGPLSTLPELSGVVLWMQGHVGVYVGNGRFIECAGGGVGMRVGRVSNGRITSGSNFTHWFKDINIQYQQEDQKMIDELKAQVANLQKQNNDLQKELTEANKIGTMKISGGNKPTKEIASIMRNGYNYGKLRDIIDELNQRLGSGIILLYDDKTKTITFNK